MVNCSIRKCKNRSGKGGSVSLFSFPKDEKIANAWLQHCRPNTNKTTARVCSIHFLPEDYHRPLRHILLNISPKRCRQIKPEAVPALHIDGVPGPTPSHKPAADKPVPSLLPTLPSIIEPSSYTRPVNQSSDNATEYIEVVPDLQLHVREEQTNSLDSSCHALKQTDPLLPDTEVHTKSSCLGTARKHTGTQTLETFSNLVVIPAAEYRDLRKTKIRYTVLNKKLHKIFTPGQIRSLSTAPEKRRRVQWTAEDIAAAAKLRGRCEKGYRYMRNVMGIPLPGYSTLCKWAVKAKAKELAKENPPEAAKGPPTEFPKEHPSELAKEEKREDPSELPKEQSLEQPKKHYLEISVEIVPHNEIKEE